MFKWALGMHRMFDNQNYSSENSKKNAIPVIGRISENGGRGGWCWLLYDDWNHKMALNN